jgi:integrase
MRPWEATHEDPLHLIKKRRVWYARMMVPEDCHIGIGKRVLVKSTGRKDRIEAALAARPIVAAWKADIARVRSLLEAGPAAFQALSRGKEAPPDPVDDLAEVWARTLPASMKPRQRGQYVVDVKQWAGRDMATWAADRLKKGDSPKTIKRRAAAIRMFVRWARKDAHWPERPDVFKTLELPKVASMVTRRAFTIPQVITLAQAATNPPLRHLIVLALATGCRLEELATLTTKSIDRHRNALHVSSKTEAGDRMVPIHEGIAGLVEDLCRNAQEPGGYLLHTHTSNRLKERGMGLGKAFGYLKTKQGFGPELVLHSIRKTVATALQDAGCPEHIAADILGHEIATMSYGVYGEGSSLETRRTWLQKAVPGTCLSEALGGP